jgi:hypothetical protein
LHLQSVFTRIIILVVTPIDLFYDLY